MCTGKKGRGGGGGGGGAVAKANKGWYIIHVLAQAMMLPDCVQLTFWVASLSVEAGCVFLSIELRVESSMVV